MRMLANPIIDLLPEVDLVVCTPATSVSVEAAAYSSQIYTFLDPLSLNLSPMRGYGLTKSFYDLSSFLSLLSSEESLLSEYSLTSSLHPSIDEYFFFDHHLTRWKKLLSEILT